MFSNNWETYSKIGQKHPETFKLEVKPDIFCSKTIKVMPRSISQSIMTKYWVTHDMDKYQQWDWKTKMVPRRRYNATFLFYGYQSNTWIPVQTFMIKYWIFFKKQRKFSPKYIQNNIENFFLWGDHHREKKIEKQNISHIIPKWQNSHIIFLSCDRQNIKGTSVNNLMWKE